MRGSEEKGQGRESGGRSGEKRVENRRAGEVVGPGRGEGGWESKNAALQESKNGMLKLSIWWDI